MEKCCDLVCKGCLKDVISQKYPDVVCPVARCGAKIDDYEVRQILGQKDYEDLQIKLALKVIDEDKGVVRCKCGNAIEVLKGEIYYDYKNDEGNAINKTAARHMSANRVRCPECGNNFCISCKAEPYHLGKTCA